jgi:hypothetical protein
MALIHTSPKQSGTAALLKILQVITDGIKLTQGKVLMGQFAHQERILTKLSLYVTEAPGDPFGVRNVFLEDVGDHVSVTVGRVWRHPSPAHATCAYPLTKLDQAAIALRDYLLFGQFPQSNETDPPLRYLLPGQRDGKMMLFDVLPTLSDHDSV